MNELTTGYASSPLDHGEPTCEFLDVFNAMGSQSRPLSINSDLAHRFEAKRTQGSQAVGHVVKVIGVVAEA